MTDLPERIAGADAPLPPAPDDAYPLDAAPLGVRPFAELRDTGLLWLINRTVFHPRGYALGLVADGSGQILGWSLLGDGSEPWRYGTEPGEASYLHRAEQTLRGQRPTTS